MIDENFGNKQHCIKEKKNYMNNIMMGEKKKKKKKSGVL